MPESLKRITGIHRPTSYFSGVIEINKMIISLFKLGLKTRRTLTAKMQ
jgi:hypothetical protein